MIYESICLKFKRTKPIIDQKSFLLQSSIDSNHIPIAKGTLINYIEALVKNCRFEITDLSSSSEQIILIECKSVLDFNQLYQSQKSKRYFQGREFSLKQIYEIESVTIVSNSVPLSMDFMETIMGSASQNVFTFTIQSNRTAVIEFINTAGLEKWLAESNVVRQQFDINTSPNVHCVNQDIAVHKNDSASCSTSPKIPQKNNRHILPPNIMMYVGRGKKIIINHSTFTIEYKNYIRSELGIEIEIRGNQIKIHNNSVVADKGNIVTLLRQRTQNFLNNFSVRSITLERSDEQLSILYAHSCSVAFEHLRNNQYMLAMKKSITETIMQKLFAIPSINGTTNNSVPSVASASCSTADKMNQEIVTALKSPPPLPNSIASDKKPIINDGVVEKVLTIPCVTPTQSALFSEKGFRECLHTYLNKKFLVRPNIDFSSEVNCKCLIKMIGQQKCIDSALEDLLNLFASCRTKTFNDPKDHGWIKITDASRIIQYHLNLMNIVCICQQQLVPLSVMVHYFDKEHIEFGIDEKLIDIVCRAKLMFSTCTATKVNAELIALKMKILQHDDYGKNICLLHEQQTLSLFGLPEVVKQFQKLFENIQMNNVPLNFNSKTNEPKGTTDPKSQILKAGNPSKSTKSNRHQDPISEIPKIPKKYSITFDIEKPGFEMLVRHNVDQLLVIVESKCQLKKQILSNQVQIDIPKAKEHYIDDDTSHELLQEDSIEQNNNSNEDYSNETLSWLLSWFQWSKPSTTPTQLRANLNKATSVNIGKSKIIVCTGDLTKQPVDAIVVCSTSRILCDTVIAAAGCELYRIYHQQLLCNSLAFETHGGDLACKSIIFRPWDYDSNNQQSLKPGIAAFVISAIQYAVTNNFKTIAFPSIGCGKLGYDPELIADYMISKTYQELENLANHSLIVSFVLLSEQQNVYNAFSNQLKRMKSSENRIIRIPFDKQIVRIELTGVDKNQLVECQTKIQQLAQSSSFKLHLTEKTDMNDWSQDTIKNYYEYCLQRRVIPKLDIQNAILDLTGPKDAVSEAEKYFFQLTAETLRTARLKVVSRGFIWSVELVPGKWEPYPYKTNQLIEDAQLSKLDHVEFINEKSERCRITFSSMVEESQNRKRQVRRTPIDSGLPSYWEFSGINFKRIVLAVSSTEYRDVLNQFDGTMKRSYTTIVKIERIQNERWYKQYAAHREEFTKRYGAPKERRLFHGCSTVSADRIVQEFFNRAFAGLNGIAYGQGVYFHEHAKYSHGFTKPDSANQRSMFLSLVLIGKTCIGNSSMKVPPIGFDTTTDGEHIFVVYHDAGAYGEYLITYQ